MPPISSTSSLADIRAAYLDNASYQENASSAQAAAFITACRAMLILPARSVGPGRGEVELDLKTIAGQLDQARRWLANNPAADGSNTGVLHVDFNSFRD